MMPYMDGFEMTQLLRRDERTSHIPIIMLTAKADMASKLEGLEHGVDAYLEKPFYKEELLLRIKKLLEQRKLLQKVYFKLVGFIPIESTIKASDNEPDEDMVISEIEIPAIENEFVNKVRDEIEKYLSDENFNVEHLSKNMFMSYSQLHRKLSAVIGHSPNQFIKILRLQKAKELLKSTDDTIANIASVCGFTDASYFGKVFKQEYGLTAHEWRKE
jgi:AraC-like DNA-binding protein